MTTPTSIETFTLTGANPSNNYNNDHHLNGDAFVSSLNTSNIRIIGVIDGAKSPFDYTVNGLPNDAFASNLMAEIVKRHFSLIQSLDEWETAMESSIMAYCVAFDIVRRGLPKFKTEDYRYFNGACAFSLALIDETTSECLILQATDCYAVVRQKGQLKNLSHYDEHAVVNSGLIDRSPLLSDWLAQGKSLEEAKKLEGERVLRNRKNTYNKCAVINNMGMAVMNGDLDLMDCLQIDRFSLKDTGTDALVFMSDGYMCKHDDIIQTAQGALNQGAVNFYKTDILPLWGSSEKDVMTDITCVKIEYSF
jgi:hypothetical protein